MDTCLRPVTVIFRSISWLAGPRPFLARVAETSFIAAAPRHSRGVHELGFSLAGLRLSLAFMLPLTKVAGLDRSAAHPAFCLGRAHACHDCGFMMGLAAASRMTGASNRSFGPAANVGVLRRCPITNWRRAPGLRRQSRSAASTDSTSWVRLGSGRGRWEW